MILQVEARLGAFEGAAVDPLDQGDSIEEAASQQQGGADQGGEAVPAEGSSSRGHDASEL